MTHISNYLAYNIRFLREKKAWTQQFLAQQAKMPRTTLTNMESGQGNPSLDNLVRVAYALGVGVEALLAKPRSESHYIPASDIPQIKRGKVQVYDLLQGSPGGLALERLVFPPKSGFAGQPHLPGTHEYLTVLQGQIEISLVGDTHLLNEGDVLIFPGHQKHTYRNPTNKSSLAMSAILTTL